MPIKPTDILRELAKIAKKKRNHKLVKIYLHNVGLHRKRAAVRAAAIQNFEIIPWE